MERNQLKPMQIGQSMEYMARTRQYQPVGVLATDTGREFVVMCSRDADPARWCVIGRLFDVTFLTHRELEDFILERNLHNGQRKMTGNSERISRITVRRTTPSSNR